MTIIERLVIDGWDSETPAWTVVDYTPLKEPADQRGSNLLIPGAVGVKALPRRNTVTVKQLPMHIFGDTGWLGDHYTDGFDGLQANIDEIIDQIVEPPGTSDGTRLATWYVPDGTVRTASVHVTALPLTRVSPIMARAVLKLELVGGRFTIVGS